MTLTRESSSDDIIARIEQLVRDIPVTCGDVYRADSFGFDVVFGEAFQALDDAGCENIEQHVARWGAVTIAALEAHGIYVTLDVNGTLNTANPQREASNV